MSIRFTRYTAALAALLTLLAAPLVAQQPKTSERAVSVESARPTALPGVHARPALWVVKDKDTTIYLFGTIHLLRPGIEWLEGPRKAALESAQELVLEVGGKLDQPTRERLAMRGLDPAGPTLTSKLPEALHPKFTKMAEQFGLPMPVVDHMKPWFAALTITQLAVLQLGYDPAQGVEQTLRSAAEQQGKTILGLETAEEQIGIFDALDADTQKALLVETIAEQDDVGATLDRMIKAWSEGDAEAIGLLENQDMESNPTLQQRLLLERNQRWADWIKARMDKPGTVFVAVGAGHLAGKGSVQDALKQRGVESKLVKDR